METDDITPLERALRLLGPLEARIMRQVWSPALPVPFVVRDVNTLLPELAYTTVMTTLSRLADKGLLDVEHVRRQRAHTYRAAGTPAAFLERAGREQVDQIVERYGEAAIAAFADRLDGLPPEQLERLRQRGDR